MLVLTRKFNQSIMIGNNIEIVVVEIKNDQVKLGIKAPKNITVHRSEVYEEIQKENRLAASKKGTNIDNLDNISDLLDDIFKDN
jgi:carbon storage regulator